MPAAKVRAYSSKRFEAGLTDAWQDRALKALALLSLTVIATALLAHWREPYQMDFLSFYAAGIAAHFGEAAAAYDLSVHQETIDGLFPGAKPLPFAYPPLFLILLAPLPALPYAVAAPLWVISSLIVFLVAARALDAKVLTWALAFPAAAICAITGQSGLLAGALMLGGMALLDKRPLLAGVLFGALAFKPQLAVLVPLALLAGREWRALASAAATAIALGIASVVAFGSESWVAFFDQAQRMSSVATANTVGWEKMASVYAALRLAGLPHAAALAVHIAIAAAAALLAWRVWASDQRRAARTAALVSASVLVSPYLFIYDLPMLAAAFAWAHKAGARFAPLVALAMLPLLAFAQFGNESAWLNPTPLIAITLLLLLSRRRP